MSEMEVDKPYDYAEENNLRVVLPASNEIQVDLDTPQQAAQFKQLWATLEGNGFILMVEESRSQSGNRHMHVRFALDNNPMADACSLLSSPKAETLVRIALQAIMGSDPVREFLGLRRFLEQTDRPPSLFFEVKETPISTAARRLVLLSTFDQPEAEECPY